MSEVLQKKTWTHEERIKAQRDCVDRHVATENARDVKGVVPKTFLKEGIYYDVVPGMAHFAGTSGEQSVQAFYDMLFECFPDLFIRMTHEYDVPGYCIREGVVTGTHSAEYAGIPASGRNIVLPFCGIYIFGDDPTGLLSERAYWDNEGLFRQMRGEITLSADLPWHKTL